MNYDFTAIPENYIDQPPKSIEAAQNNLKLIEQVNQSKKKDN
jgi:hypothetical protein